MIAGAGTDWRQGKNATYATKQRSRSIISYAAALSPGNSGSTSVNLLAGQSLTPSRRSSRGGGHLRAAWPREHRKGVDTLFALVSWRIWKEQNARCFQEAVSSVADLMTIIKAEGELWVHAGALGKQRGIFRCANKL
jgi:hypothetical protein